MISVFSVRGVARNVMTNWFNDMARSKGSKKTLDSYIVKDTFKVVGGE